MGALEIKPAIEPQAAEAAPFAGNGNALAPLTDGQVRARIREIVDSGQASLTQIGSKVGISAAVMSRWYRGIYEGRNEDVSGKVADWLSLRQSEAKAQVPPEPEFVPTRNADRVLNALQYGQATADFVLIHGEAGLGKTRACTHYERSRPNVWIARMNPTTASAAACLSKIRQSLGLRAARRGAGAADMLRHLVDFFRDSGGMLIIDEAQHLSLAALETIRAIYDEAGMGLALVGNDIVYSRLKGGGDTALFAQIYSRIGKRVALKAVDDTDAERFAAAFGVTEPTAVTDLQAIAKKPGALRGVVKTLRLAAMFARGAGETLSTTHIKTAWRELGGAQ